MNTIAQNFLHAEGKKIVEGNGEPIILRGMGLGGYMLQEGYMLKFPFSGQQYVIKNKIEDLIGPKKTEKFYEAWLFNHTRQIDIDSLKAWGFNSVRLPMHYNLFTLPTEKEPVVGQNTWLKKGFQLTDSILKWCEANNMYLILDMHATPGGQGHDLAISDRDPTKPSLWESEANQQKLIALWKKLATRYADEPFIGAYDIINEPNWSFEPDKIKSGVNDTKNAPLRKLMVEITTAIREVDKNHMIIIEGNGWGNNYKGIPPLWDDNMVLSFHRYWIYNNQESLQNVLKLREKYNVPIWMGESGENSNVWFTDAISLLEKNNIGWCWWPLKKIGNNNPLEIKISPGYQKILNYWNGKAKKPSKQVAFQGLMQLAENSKLKNCIFHKDIIDAMVRQVKTNTTIPFKKEVITERSSIKAVNYDLGRINTAYFDNVAANYHISTGKGRTSWNDGHQYRNDGVDIFKDSTERNSADYYVGNIETNEWLQYTFSVKKAGNYNLAFQVASTSNHGLIAININDGAVIKQLKVPNTTGKWQFIPLKNIPLNEGKNTLKFKATNGGFKFKSIKFER
ncbi:MAG TPA: cellulase family glycosylhydrolase [Salinimicrobium sp.]|nr:cellulase family glycosylhydrolase [Salinimicrobium sp.]